MYICTPNNKGIAYSARLISKSRTKGEISSAGSEHLPYKQGVTGSNPVSPTKIPFRIEGFLFETQHCPAGIYTKGQRTKGRLAQLVQSTCLTSRGSLVRTQYLPLKKTIPIKWWLSFFLQNTFVSNSI